MRIIFAIVSLIVMFDSGRAQDVEQVTGLIGKSVRLPCLLPHGDGDRVRWVDWVYNTGRQASDIYDSDRGTIAEDHPNVANFRVDEADYSLTITNLKFENGGVLGDAGVYICMVEEEELEVQLDVGGLPECSGEVDLVEGDATKLKCNVLISGSTLPQLTWWLDGEMMTSDDMTSIGEAQQDAPIDDALWSMDGARAVCKMRMGDFEEDCAMTLTVQHLVRDLKISPDGGVIRVGDEIKCTASGNPEPLIEFEGEDLPQIKEDTQRRSFMVPQSWQGKQVPVICKASNTLDGQVENLSQDITFDVLDERTTTTTTTPEPSTVATTTEEVVVPPEPKPTRAKTPEPTEAKKIEAEKTTTIVTPKDLDPATGSTNIAGIVAAVVIVALVVCVIVIAVICIKRKSSSKPPKGSKPVPTKEEEVKAMEGGRA